MVNNLSLDLFIAMSERERFQLEDFEVGKLTVEAAINSCDIKSMKILLKNIQNRRESRIRYVMDTYNISQKDAHHGSLENDENYSDLFECEERFFNAIGYLEYLVEK